MRTITRKLSRRPCGFRCGLMAAGVAAALHGPGLSAAELTSIGRTGVDTRPASELVDMLKGFYPNVTVYAGYDDNVRRVENNTESSPFVGAQPTLNWGGRFYKHRVGVNYRGDYGTYTQDTNSSFLNHRVRVGTDLDLTPKLNANLVGAYAREAETWGWDRRPTDTDRPDRWTEWAARGEVIYGRREAKAQIGLDASIYDRKFTNNNQEPRDRTVWDVATTFYYNIGPKTQALLEARYENVNYDQNWFDVNYQHDAEVKRFLLGATWRATAKTTGSFKIGYFDRHYETSQLEDEDGLALNLSMTWQPKTYSTVKVFLSRDTDETKQDETSDLVSTQLTVNWEHTLRPRLGFEIGATIQNDDYNNSDDTREDDLRDFILGLNYQFRRWLQFSAQYKYEERDSNIEGLDYTANVFRVTAQTNF